MNIVIAGSRSINHYRHLLDGIRESKFNITGVISGGARGVDSLAILWAQRNKVPFEVIPADWTNLDQPGAIVRPNRHGDMYNANAGFYRNTQMIDKGEGLLLIWDGISNGSKDSLTKAKAAGMLVYVHLVTKNKQ